MPVRTALTAREIAFITLQRVGHLATSDANGHPHVVPVCYAWDGKRFWVALDEKPKQTAPMLLKRVRNILARGEASLVIDRYEDDWSRLGFVLVSGAAQVTQADTAGHAGALSLLRQRYSQYRTMALEQRPLITLAPAAVTAWGNLETSDNEHALQNVSEGRGIDFLPLARARRSVRRFTPDPVPRALVEYVLEAARWAPSPHGRQPWRFTVLTSISSKERLANAMGAEWERNLKMDQEPPEIVASRLASSRERIVRAPVLIMPCLYLADLDRYPDPQRQAAEETMAIQSLGAAIQNLLLAAYAVGLDGGWMCAPLFCPDVVRDAMGLDVAFTPHALITLGYAAKDPARRPRLPLDDLIAWYD